MYETLVRLWGEGKLTEAMLENAVTKGWITETQKTEITAQYDDWTKPLSRW